ncbi:MAG: alpha/beta fold hydrolase [Hyphomonadaceae bacterium]
MLKRTFVSALSALVLAACASSSGDTASEGPSAPAAQGFVSDRISVATRGEGPDVILIPGMTSSASVWDATADGLDDDYRVHVVQVKGFAGVPAEANADGLVSAPVAEEVARYVRESGLQRPALIGHSMGGSIGIMVAARHPDQVGRLMVVDMFPFMGAMFGGQTAEAVRPAADAMRGQMLAAPPGAATPMVESMIANMTLLESIRPELVRQARESDRQTVANAFHELIVTDLRPELPNISAPLTVLYVIPPEIPFTPEQYEQFFNVSFSGAPQARVIKIENSRHFIQFDAPERFMSEVRTFLAE